MNYLQCFSAGAEIGQHKNDHPYKFMVCIGLIRMLYFKDFL